ncbi:hypothetical protein BDDG_13855, partial [Blastomyces dermatitidis ATCC 18188]
MSNDDFDTRYGFSPTPTSFIYPSPTKTTRMCKDKFGNRHRCPDKSLVAPLVGVLVGLLVLVVC